VRLATFNMLSGRSLPDGEVRTQDLVDAATELDADVVGLQEVDRHQERSGGVDQTATVAQALGAGWSRFVPSVDGTPGGAWTPATADDGSLTSGPTYGVGLVSRFPVLSFQVRRFGAAPIGLPLMVPGRRGLTMVPDEPRLALAAVIEGPAGPVTVLTAHLSFVPGWNVRQLRAVARWAGSMPGPRFLLGDFNLPGPMPRILTGWTQLARVPTYPSWRPRVQLDHVLADRPTSVAAARALRLRVSDHCALAVDLAPRPPAHW
jgi:endonuclease/exonuclease/phosphatase family metal-dependent hydrolase